MLTIGRIAKASGCKVQTIRYYEQAGLIDEPVRSAGNQRLYKKSDVDRLQFIRHARSLGFSMQVIKELLTLENHQEMSCIEVDQIANRQLENIRERIKQLTSLADELLSMINQCAHGDIADCQILAALHNHQQCGVHKPLDI